MPDFRSNLILGTRGSALALAQTNAIRALLRTRWPRLETEIKIIKTKGDAFQNLSLTTSGDKGLFTREIEQALLRNQIDLAIHSLKDLPTLLPGGLTLAAVPKRADPRDVIICRSTLQRAIGDLPPGAHVATSSLRRKAQLLALRPDLVIEEIRGNVETRLTKLAESDSLQALVLAAAGLQRLEVRIEEGKLLGKIVPDSLFARPLSFDEMLPAIGQGALGLEIRAEDGRIQVYVEALNHYASAQAVVAERAFLAGLRGGCSVPIAAIAEIHESELHLRGAVFATDGSRKISGAVQGKPDDAEALGKQLAEELKAQGAEQILTIGSREKD